MKIAQDEAEILFLYAFRYALGRMTYASAEVSELIIKHLPYIPAKAIELIKKEAGQALAANRAGMDCDCEQWLKMLEAINLTLRVI